MKTRHLIYGSRCVFAATTIKKTTRNYDNFYRTLIMTIIKVLKIVPSRIHYIYIFPLTMLPLFLCLFTINNMVHVEYREGKKIKSIEEKYET